MACRKTRKASIDNLSLPCPLDDKTMATWLFTRSATPIARNDQKINTIQRLIQPKERGKQYMSSKLYVGGLSWSTTDQTLRQTFQPYGEIQDLILIADRETGRSKGFGFVTFSDENSAQAAIAELNGRDLDGRNITVSVAQEKTGFNGGKNKKPSRDRW
jgi:RNA recognition motif-containing protein